MMKCTVSGLCRFLNGVGDQVVLFFFRKFRTFRTHRRNWLHWTIRSDRFHRSYRSTG